LVKDAKAVNALLSQITAKRQQRLAEISAREKEAAGHLKREAAARLEALLTERKRKRIHELLAEHERRLSEAGEARRVKLWAFEQEKINELESAVRDALEGRQPDVEQLRRWVNRARKQLGARKELVLEVKAEWLNLLKSLKGVEIRAGNMSGGAFLTDMQSGMQVDASWETRLHDLIPELRDRWRKDVGADHQD